MPRKTAASAASSTTTSASVRPRAGHGRRPGADHPVLAGVDEARRIGARPAADGEALAAVEDDPGRAAVDVHGQELLAAGARIERARVARLVGRPPRAGRARGETPGVDERPVTVRRARPFVRDEPVDGVAGRLVVERRRDRRRAGDADDDERREERSAHDQRRGGAVDSRTMSFVESSMRSASTRWPSIRRIRRLTPVRPISASGWRTEVRRGRDDHRMLGVVEADDREILGHAQVRARAPRAARRSATLSLKPKIAVGGSEQREQLRAASVPRSMRQSE